LRPPHGRPDTDFFLEFDRGTETDGRVAAKLAGYARLAASTGITTPVLFWFPGPGRESAVRAALSGSRVPVATASPAAGASPADAVWLPAGRDGPRLPLAALAIPAPGTGASRPTAVPPAQPAPSLTGGPVPPMPPP
jgi:Replication-relaxation